MDRSGTRRFKEWYPFAYIRSTGDYRFRTMSEFDPVLSTSRDQFQSSLPLQVPDGIEGGIQRQSS
jgi:hypothetical protein